MRASSERVVRTVGDAWLGATAYGLFAADGDSVRRWAVSGTPEERARWCALFKRGISVADLLFLEPRWRRQDMRALLRSWLQNGWLDGSVVPEGATLDGSLPAGGSSPAGPAPEEQAAGGVLVFGESPSLRKLLPEATHVPRQSGAAAAMRAWLSAAEPKLVVYDAHAMQWAGLSVLHRHVIGHVDLLALFGLGASFAAIVIPKGSPTCLGCAERWLVGSSQFPREIGAWLRGLITEAVGQVEPLAPALERELSDLADGLRTGGQRTASVTVARGGEPPQRVRLLQHPSCPTRHTLASPTSAWAADVWTSASQAQSTGIAPPAVLLERYVAELSGPAGLFHSLRVENVAEPEGAPYYFASAAFNTGFLNHYSDPVHCFGDGDDTALASLRCVAECIERFCTFHFDTASLRRASYAELGESAIAPPELTLYSETQYRANGFPFPRFDPKRSMHWVRGRALVSGREVWVPAELVFVGWPSAGALTTETTAGTAIHQTFEGAASGGLLELLERDALSVSFLTRHAPPRLPIPPGSDAGEKARLITDAGYEVVALDLRLDVDVSIVLVLALRPAGPAPLLLKGAGSSLQRDRALAQAMREVWRSFLYYRRHPETPSFGRSAHPWSMEYGLAYYQRPEALESLRFLLRGPEATPPDRTAESRPETLSCLLDAVAEAKLEPIAVDCTLPMVRDVGLHCIRVLVPGLQPLSVGEAPWRLGGRRVFELPRRLRWRDEPLTEAELNRTPHFFT